MISILHVDMSVTFRHVARKVVEKIDGKYWGVSSAAQAFECLEKHRIDLIITGIELEELTAAEMIRNLNHSKFSDIPVIVISGSDSLTSKREYFELGVIDFIPKSDMVEQKLRRYLNVYVENRELQKEIDNLDIAVVDDSKASLLVIKKVFQANKLENVDYYSDTNTLFNSKKSYSIYILDMILPEISGREVILRLREQDSNSVIIAVSGMGDYKTISNVLTIGANDYLIKPFNADIFISRLKSNVRSMLMYKELEQAKDRLKILSERDGLTGLYNHMTILNKLDALVAERHALSILLFDVDNFKAVNDTYGHQVGDKLLSCIATTLEAKLQPGQLYGRFGGEEFLLIWPGFTLEESKEAARCALADVRTCTFGEENISVTISGGVAEYNGQSAEEMVKLADRRLYNAKSTGKNRVFYLDMEVVE